MKRLDNIYKKASKITGIDKNIIGDIYSHFWSSIKSEIELIPFSEINTNEELDKTKTSFSIPFFGKLYVSKNTLLKLNNIKKDDNS